MIERNESSAPSMLADGLETIFPAEPRGARVASTRAAELLIGAMRELASARNRHAVADIVKTTARKLVGADGATFVLKDGTQCFYLDEDAISPLWKGQRFPLEACVSGWVMRHSEQIAMPDIYVDPRVPHEAYRPTFVKSLVMTPVRRIDPVAAIGIYWADYHVATERELSLLQNLADTTAVALENAQVYEELERRVAERTEQLTHANMELEAFSHTVAHDLRSPLNAIIGFADLLAEPQLTTSEDKARMFASEISRAGRRMNDLIGALLEFARDANVEVAASPCDVSELATRVGAFLRMQATHPAVALHVQPGLRASADPTLLEVVLTNLLGNAFKYSSKVERPEVEVGSAASGDGQTTFFVRDNGAGFDPSQAPKLFTPFQRLHHERDFAGNGVGLATVARIVRRHGGKIWAEGQRGAGATFYFTLPTLA